MAGGSTGALELGVVANGANVETNSTHHQMVENAVDCNGIDDILGPKQSWLEHLATKLEHQNHRRCKPNNVKSWPK